MERWCRWNGGADGNTPNGFSIFEKIFHGVRGATVAEHAVRRTCLPPSIDPTRHESMGAGSPGCPGSPREPRLPRLPRQPGEPGDQPINSGCRVSPRASAHSRISLLLRGDAARSSADAPRAAVSSIPAARYRSMVLISLVSLFVMVLVSLVTVWLDYPLGTRVSSTFSTKTEKIVPLGARNREKWGW